MRKTLSTLVMDTTMMDTGSVWSFLKEAVVVSEDRAEEEVGEAGDLQLAGPSIEW